MINRLLLDKIFLKIVAKVFNEIKTLKKIISKKVNINRYLNVISKELMKKYKIKIEYLELRNVINLKKSNTIKNSKLFIAYYINEIRLIDNL